MIIKLEIKGLLQVEDLLASRTGLEVGSGRFQQGDRCGGGKQSWVEDDTLVGSSKETEAAAAKQSWVEDNTLAGSSKETEVAAAGELPLWKETEAAGWPTGREEIDHGLADGRRGAELLSGGEEAPGDLLAGKQAMGRRQGDGGGGLGGEEMEAAGWPAGREETHHGLADGRRGAELSLRRRGGSRRSSCGQTGDGAARRRRRRAGRRAERRLTTTGWPAG